MGTGFLHIYTGNGKGKTTAALGLALRAAGAGKRVLLAQFLKKADCSEHKALERFRDRIKVCCFGTGEFVKREVRPDQIRQAKNGLEEISLLLMQEHFDCVILDEIIAALAFGVISIEELLDFIGRRPPDSEMVLTGRGAPQRLIDIADLVTEMVEVKHYFHRGIAAREGIEK
jgi:cob(I)alamin adenosyltransferase